ncbi:MAG: SPOR domain-containing protein, partial [Bacteroidales bacterium]|nr:SPOR domain-containing protein [Bacteroidales bacterium]
LDLHKDETSAPAPAAVPAPTPQQTVQPTVQNETVAAVRYGTQIFASSRIIPSTDPMFMGYEPTIINIGSLNKYIIGIFESEEEARKANVAIKANYPGSFMVKLTAEGVTRFK